MSRCMGLHKKCIKQRLKSNVDKRLGPSTFGRHLKKKFAAGRLSSLEVGDAARASGNDASDVKHLCKMTPGSRKRRGKEVPDSRGASTSMSRIMDKHDVHYAPLIADVHCWSHAKTNR